MPPIRFCFLAAALFCSITQACAEPPVIPLPSHALAAPPAASAPGSPLTGSWNDGSCLLLPPGITPFETITDTLTFRADGTWTQTINKATGRLQTRGAYAVTGTRLTLSSLLTRGAMQYEISRTGDRLRLQPVSSGKSAALTLSRVAVSELESPFL